MKSILIDVTKCVGCEECVEACSDTKNLGKEIHFEREKKDGLSSRRLTSVIQLSENRFAKKSCLHCIDPGCVTACLCGGMEKTESGAVIYNEDKCIGCRYCMLGCPIGIPRYEWDKLLPYVKKCDMCYDRQKEGKIPACVEACPHEALVFGERDELITKARNTIRANPDRYLQHIYGEKEFGGTSVMYITDTELDAIGWESELGDRKISSITWPVMSKTPFVGGSVALFLTGTFFIINRRMKMENQELRKKNLETSESKSQEGEKDSE
jgi:formate dehydrogenase iron-sulfur subunit